MNNPPIKGFLETSFLDWPGKVSAVLFLGGCNLRCPFCHNPALISKSSSKNLNWGEIKARLQTFSSWLDGLVITGGEPTVYPDLILFIEEIKSLGYAVKLDTNGGQPQTINRLLENNLIDNLAMDIKAQLADPYYEQASGRANFYPLVKESLQILSSAKIPYTLRTTVVPGLHSKDQLLNLADELAAHPNWHLQNFKPGDLLNPSFNQLTPFTEDEFVALKAKVEERRMGLGPTPRWGYEPQTP